MSVEETQMSPTSCRAVILSGNGSDLKILLLRRKFPPYDGNLTLPGGFIKSEESPSESITRKVLKETGLNLEVGFKCFPLMKRSKNLDPRAYQVTQNYLFLAEENFDPEDEDFSGEERPEWYYLDEVEKLGFNHGAILCEALGVLWTKLSKQSVGNSLVDLPREFSDLNIDWKAPVVFFGGSFNPWHEGHQACLDLCPNKNIVIVPDTNPWKIELNKKGNCFWSDYRKMAEKFFQKGFAVFPGYFGIEEGNPTVNWLPHVDCERKEFLMGYDSFYSFHRWKNVNQLIKFLERLYVVPRNVSEVQKSGIDEQMVKLKDDIEINILGEHSYMDMSSTNLRKDN